MRYHNSPGAMIRRGSTNALVTGTNQFQCHNAKPTQDLIPSYLIPCNSPRQLTLDGGMLEGFCSAGLPTFDIYEE